MQTHGNTMSDPRPFPGTGLRVVHLEKSGPAWDREFIPVRVTQQLAKSLVAQTCTAAGEVFNALDRQCFLDLMKAWQRLLVIADVTPVPARLATSTRHFWSDMRQHVTLALCKAEQRPNTEWLKGDLLMRQYASEVADLAREHLRYPAELGIANTEQLAKNCAAYEAFAKGRRV